ncbi:clumping factor B-like [Leptopilina boulardi]|uniref:clumping factor B-like n=1 Tax=Leptopilina boulardi TaxID=63433 RepID=UPI0021F52CB7|nr:clumping factor B-like [Leptopilina boulardi]
MEISNLKNEEENPVPKDSRKFSDPEPEIHRIDSEPVDSDSNSEVGKFTPRNRRPFTDPETKDEHSESDSDSNSDICKSIYDDGKGFNDSGTNDEHTESDSDSDSNIRKSIDRERSDFNALETKGGMNSRIEEPKTKNEYVDSDPEYESCPKVHREDNDTPSAKASSYGMGILVLK